jgi:hypothetical protein
MATREKIGTGKNARYVRRDADGGFTSAQVNVGRSLIRFLVGTCDPIL